MMQQTLPLIGLRIQEESVILHTMGKMSSVDIINTCYVYILNDQRHSMLKYKFYHTEYSA